LIERRLVNNGNVGDPDAQGQTEIPRREGIDEFNAVLQSLSNLQVGVLPRVRHQHREFIAAQSREDIGLGEAG
jgi:hypothetical protein